jgi:hypothetical protein
MRKPAKSRSRAASGSAANTAATEANGGSEDHAGRAGLERIAVVFVHGQGEQTPMTDVVDLVDTVWRTDPRAQAAGAGPAPGLAPVYSVPIFDAAADNQRRISTRRPETPAGRKQVDFYQFYWADLMEGNRLQHLWIWFTGLMRREPNEVPEKVWSIRMAAMLIALALGAWGTIFALVTAMRLATEVSLGASRLISALLALSALSVIHNWLARKRIANKTASKLSANGPPVAAGLIAALAISLGFARTGWDWSAWPSLALAGVLALILGFLFSAKPPANRRTGLAKGLTVLLWLVFLAGVLLLDAAGLSAGRLHLGWSWRNGVALALAAGAAWTLPLLVAPDRRASAMAWGTGLIAACLLVGLYVLFHGATFGEGYAFSVLPLPWGAPLHLALTRPLVVSLHGAAASGVLVLALVAFLFVRRLDESFLTPVMTDSARMFSNSPDAIPNQNRIRERGLKLLEFLHDQNAGRRYDRIVVLAHSLGTVVAYRLLAHYWGKVYTDLPKADLGNLEKAAADLNADEPGALVAWRAAVRARWDALWAAAPPPAPGDKDRRRPWLISDFVTIGSPLTYARLLLEASDRDFVDQIRIYKRHPTSPPQPIDAPGEGASPSMFGEDGWTHHAALFSATVWTNLFFPPYGIGRGDLIGGPIAGDPPKGLGRGVLDVNLDKDESVAGFTHGDYWLWPRNAKLAVSPAGAPPIAPMHVAAIRDALGLFERGRDVDTRLLNPEGYIPPKGALQLETDDGTR